MRLDTFGIGILGTGIMGRKMLAALQQHPRFRVVAAWDPDADALQAALAPTTGVRAAASADSLVGDAAVDGVYIASPPAWHASAVRSVQAGRARLRDGGLNRTRPDQPGCAAAGRPVSARGARSASAVRRPRRAW